MEDCCACIGLDSGCFTEPYVKVENCECHSSCKTCGYNDSPTGPDDCIKCAYENISVTPINSDGTGTCSCDVTTYTDSVGNGCEW